MLCAIAINNSLNNLSPVHKTKSTVFELFFIQSCHQSKVLLTNDSGVSHSQPSVPNNPAEPLPR